MDTVIRDTVRIKSFIEGMVSLTGLPSHFIKANTEVRRMALEFIRDTISKGCFGEIK